MCEKGAISSSFWSTLPAGKLSLLGKDDHTKFPGYYDKIYSPGSAIETCGPTKVYAADARCKRARYPF